MCVMCNVYGVFLFDVCLKAPSEHQNVMGTDFDDLILAICISLHFHFFFENSLKPIV